MLFAIDQEVAGALAPSVPTKMPVITGPPAAKGPSAAEGTGTATGSSATGEAADRNGLDTAAQILVAELRAARADGAQVRGEREA